VANLALHVLFILMYMCARRNC